MTAFCIPRKIVLCTAKTTHTSYRTTHTCFKTEIRRADNVVCVGGSWHPREGAGEWEVYLFFPRDAFAPALNINSAWVYQRVDELYRYIECVGTDPVVDLRSSGFPKNDGPVVIYQFVTFAYIYSCVQCTRGDDGFRCAVVAASTTSSSGHCPRDEKSFVKDATRTGSSRCVYTEESEPPP